MGLVELLDQINEAILDAASGWWTLIGLFLFCVVDGFFPVLPSDALVVGLGSVHSEPGTPYGLWVILVAAGGALLGDFIAYRMGRAIGTSRFRWMRKPAAQRAFTWARHELDKRGVLVIFVGRFIPGGRVSINFVAGATRFSMRRFLIIDAFASLAWASYSFGLGVVGASIFDSLIIAMAVSIGGAVVLGLILDQIFRMVTRWLDRRGVEIDAEDYQDTSDLPVERPIHLKRRSRTRGEGPDAESAHPAEGREDLLSAEAGRGGEAGTGRETSTDRESGTGTGAVSGTEAASDDETRSDGDRDDRRGPGARPGGAEQG